MDSKFKVVHSQHRYVDFKDIDTERQFLGGLLCNQGFFKKVVNGFSSEMFTNVRLKNIYEKVVELYTNEGTFVNDLSLLKTLSVPKNKLPLYESILKKLISIGKANHKSSFLSACKYKLENYYDARIIEIGMKDLIKILTVARDGDFRKIEGASEIVRGLASAIDTKTVSNIKVNPIINFSRWMQEYEYWQKNPGKMLGIPTGIPPIDKRIVGIRPSEFGLCIADTGVGKSIFLLDAAIHCWQKYGDIIYITIEMPSYQLENRFWCNLSGLPYDKFRQLTMHTDEKDVLKKLMRRYSKHDFKFNIVDMNEGCTVSDIASEISNYFKKGEIKLVVIDYMNIIAGNDGKVSLDWETQVGIALNLKQFIARKFQVPVWSACQVTGENLAFSRHIRDNIDIGLKLEENEDTEVTGIMEVSYPKSRDFKGTKHVIKTDRGTMKIHSRE